eukprot:CAMPEP_0203985006 /NCGR_PEP_ID=MMETSP0360-20130528/5015_1 /ASSEMBLY_ACC=CAM_ASM_000342 /TAXON_ID=268821 /ORGANISM="Scrippsiella Hangoei, Strain SHTV-5" /LENGTH=63 /DNA_ID=CAMNT_0050924209 /DNA_START=72 /DNA_END=260 /DNA_ORIENTATION=+
MALVTGLAVFSAAAAGLTVGLTCTQSDTPSSRGRLREPVARAHETFMMDVEAPSGQRPSKSSV